MSGLRRRAGALCAALAIQAGFVTLFLLPAPRFPVHEAQERVFLLPPLRKAVTRPPAIARKSVPARTMPSLLPASPPAVSAPTAPQDIAGIGRALFGCAPQDYSQLSPDDRRLCDKPGGDVVRLEPDLMGSPSHVKDEAHWREEWAREKAAPILPCLGGVNVLCALIKLADGTLFEELGDPRTWPRYDIDQLPSEEFYKIAQAYDAWHKAHPVTPETDCARRSRPGASRDRPAGARSPCPALPPAPASGSSPPRPGWP